VTETRAAARRGEADSLRYCIEHVGPVAFASIVVTSLIYAM